MFYMQGEEWVVDKWAYLCPVSQLPSSFRLLVEFQIRVWPPQILNNQIQSIIDFTSRYIVEIIKHATVIVSLFNRAFITFLSSLRPYTSKFAILLSVISSAQIYFTNATK